ncbi:hypothetical protein E5D57_009134 [Metarhizium anisopliae]|nr:hypothetical protein E5D57_009134 [Metarhizium anisopliae]
MSPDITSSREQLDPFSLCANATRSAPYSYHAPSPPSIHIPPPKWSADPECAMELLPPLQDGDPSQLNDIQIITRNERQVAQDSSDLWVYGNRYQAQAILDFLYLGPNSVMRDHAFLEREGITMILIVRPWHFTAMESSSAKTAKNELKISVEYIDVNGLHDLIRTFPRAVKLINDHLLGRDHPRSTDSERDVCEMDGIIAPSSSCRRGKVLVTCATGMDWSPAIVAAYVMSVFRKDVVTALQFISLQRVCCAFDEDLKRILQSWGDILSASSAVAQHAHHQGLEAAKPGLGQHGKGSAMGAGASAPKRGLDDMMDVNEDDCQDTGGASSADLDRFIGRGPFAPFADAMHGN